MVLERLNPVRSLVYNQSRSWPPGLIKMMLRLTKAIICLTYINIQNKPIFLLLDNNGHLFVSHLISFFGLFWNVTLPKLVEKRMFYPVISV